MRTVSSFHERLREERRRPLGQLHRPRFDERVSAWVTPQPFFMSVDVARLMAACRQSQDAESVMPTIVAARAAIVTHE